MPVHTERRGRTFLIVLDRPDAMNALDGEMFNQLGDAWDTFEDDPEMLAAVITGAGERAFCAGRDLIKGGGEDDAGRTRPRRLTPDGIWKPVLAAVNGHCLAAGFGIALGCDLRVASTNATFGTMGARRGIVAGGGQTQRLPRYIPFGLAMELLLTADRIDAEAALRYGLVNRVVEPGDLLAFTMDWAARIAQNGPLAMASMKRAAYEGAWEMPLRDGLRLEAGLYAGTLKTEDATEGARAFAERREPRFRGR